MKDNRDTLKHLNKFWIKVNSIFLRIEIPQFRGGKEKAYVLPHDMLSMGHGRTDEISGGNLYLKRDQ
jgi:hypothetical protein